jgi:hypothetical protein
MKKTILLLCFTIFISTQSFTTEGIDQGSSWINIKYIECLTDKLPCECEIIAKPYAFISVDTNSNSDHYGVVLMGFNHPMDPNFKYIKKIGEIEYAVFKWQTGMYNNGHPLTDTIFAKLTIEKDTLYYIENDIQSKFIKSKTIKKYDEYQDNKDNVYLLNIALNKRGYPPIEQIVAHNSLLCECNPWIGGTSHNLLYTYEEEQPSLCWVLDIVKDSIYIKKVIFGDDIDDPIRTENFISFKWE